MKKLVVIALAIACILCIGMCSAIADTCEDGKHQYNKYVTIENPTCTKEGSRAVYCSICNDYKGVEPIGKIGHVAGTPKTTVQREATCTDEGLEVTVTVCKDCGTEMDRSTRAIPAKGHKFTWIVDKEPTCTSTGYRRHVCSVCSLEEKSEVLAMKDHTPGNWEAGKAATCTEKGTQVRKCTVCGATVETRNTDALGHDWGTWSVTKSATCEKDGEQSRVCERDSSHKETKKIPATGHEWGEWTVTKEATCEGKGKKVRVCQHDSSHKDEQDIPATGHKWGNWTITVIPACEKEGSRTRVCETDPSHKQTEKLKATGHLHTSWKVTKEPTYTEPGGQELWCDDCGKLLKTVKIPVKTYSSMHNICCAFGPRLRDTVMTPANDNWYMYTPFDASEDGRQTYDLVASNHYVVGQLFIDVKEGNVTVSYTLNGANISIPRAAFTIAPSFSELFTLDPEVLLANSMKTNNPYSIEEEFGGDTNLVLYFASPISYSIDRNVETLHYDSVANQEIVRHMLEIMDR